MDKYESFCACNSRKGFTSFFDDIFFADNIKKRYIIKGGPGTGKSTLMKAVARYAERQGYETERYYCSSDINSLDGVIVRGANICIFDGTAPHCYDCRYPGAVDTFADITSFWDEAYLRHNSDKIKKLFAECGDCYKKAYNILSAIGKLFDEYYTISVGAADGEKIEKAAKGYAKMLKSGEGKRTIRPVTAISSAGVSVLNAFKDAEKIYLFEDGGGVGTALLKRLDEIAAENAEYCPLPLDCDYAEALYFRESGILFTTNKKLVEGRKHINVRKRRFLKASENGYKNLLSFYEKAARELAEKAFLHFGEAKAAHDKLERIYGDAIDFDEKEIWTEQFIPYIFGKDEWDF